MTESIIVNHKGVAAPSRNVHKGWLTHLIKLDGVAPLMTDPPPISSTTLSPPKKNKKKINKKLKKKKKLTRDTWHVTRDTWHVTRDTWHLTRLGGWTFSQNFSSLALTVCDLWYYEDLEEKDDSLNELDQGRLCQTRNFCADLLNFVCD